MAAAVQPPALAEKKLYISYNEIHQAICDAVEREELYETFRPTLIIAIGSGGFIPARMLRTFLKAKCGRSLPIQTIGLVLYDDNEESLNMQTAQVRKTQWLNYSHEHGTGVALQGHNILIVDEVDDTRKTLHFAVAELTKDIEQQRREYLERKAPGDPDWQEPKLGIFVVHDKDKPKVGSLPQQLLDTTYYRCLVVPDEWIVYPWDALDISAHQKRADERLQQSQKQQPATNGTS